VVLDIVGTTKPAENSEVLLIASVAVAVTIWPSGTATLSEAAKVAVPLPSVVVLMEPRNSCPSGAPPAKSGWLATGRHDRDAQRR
jgi:hypothetical protein